MSDALKSHTVHTTVSARCIALTPLTCFECQSGADVAAGVGVAGIAAATAAPFSIFATISTLAHDELRLRLIIALQYLMKFSNNYTHTETHTPIHTHTHTGTGRRKHTTNLCIMRNAGMEKSRTSCAHSTKKNLQKSYQNDADVDCATATTTAKALARRVVFWFLF